MDKKTKKKEREKTSSFPARRDCTVRVGPLASIPEILHSLGKDPALVLSQVGLMPSLFENPDERIPYLQASRMLAQCVSATGCEHFGLLVGERAGPSHLGVAGFLVRSAPDVASALHDLLTNLDLHDEGGTLTLVTTGEVGMLGYAVCQPDAQALEQIYDLSLAVACNIMRSLCGPAWNPIQVMLSRHRPQDQRPYRRFFRAPIRFDAEQSALAFPAQWFKHKPSFADPMLHDHLEKEARDLHTQLNTTLLKGLRPLLQRCLYSRQCSTTEIAKRLGIHERTLSRRLRAEGTSFQRELDASRYLVSRQLLIQTDTTLDDIAASLGYSDASAFSRAFKRWSGTTPARWRKRQDQH